MKYITLPIEQRKDLERRFSVTRVCVWLALCYKRDSDLCRRIREAALEMGGRIIRELDITDGFMPNCRTDFEHDGEGVRRLVMSYPNGVRLEIDAAKGSATLTAEGRPVLRYWNVTADSLYTVALEAQQLSEAGTEAALPA